MHREFRPEDMHPFETDPFAVVSADGDAHGSWRLYAFTAFLGLLIGVDLLLDWAGVTYRPPLGLSPVMIAALGGAVCVVYGALEALVHRRIGADFALAQACLAALILGQPFVAAEVVFIALVGEVLEAVTFARTKRALGRLVDQTPHTARVRRDGI